MGTSKGFGGPPSGLVPSWADDPASGAVPAGQPAAGDGGGTSTPAADTGLPPGLQQPVTGRLTQARGNFTKYARTGSRSYLGGAVRRYVGSVGGASGAARRMGASRVAAGNLLGVVRDVQTRGIDEALRARGLQRLIGRPAEEVLLGLLEIVCLPGGPVDEGISRQALLEAVKDQAEDGVVSFGQLTPEQLKEFFLDYVIRSIEGKVISDIAARAISVPLNADLALQLEDQLRDFIAGATRSHIGAMLDGSEALPTDSQINDKVSRIYEAAFTFLAQVGEDAE